MFKFGNQEFRILEEQVMKNKDDIQDFKDGNQTIAEFGITVVGIVPTAGDMPATADNYGDAYLVGDTAPYDMRVWTRDVANNTAKWVDLGQFPLAGPQGEKGPDGSKIYFGNINNAVATRAGDYFLDGITGNWYCSYYSIGLGYFWNLLGNLKGEKGDRGIQGLQGPKGATGPQGNVGPIGPAGPQGPKGDVGPAFNVQGTLASSANLPTPTAEMQDKGYAYIIPDAEGNKHIWVIQGPDSGPFSWVDMGTAGVGIKGEQGADGVGITTLTDTDLTYGDVTVDYNTTDGMTITGTMRQTYEGGNHDSTMDLEIPIIAGDGISIDKAEDSEKIVIKSTGGDDSNYAKLIAAQNVFKNSNTATSNIILNTPDNTTPYMTVGDTDAANNIVKGEGVTIGSNYINLKKTASDGFNNRNALRISINDNGVARFSLFRLGFNTHIDIPTNIGEFSTFVTSNSVKTLFGNQSIVGSGNIDLYMHNIRYTSIGSVLIDGVTLPMIELQFIIYSSKNLVVDSLTDLKTLLGDTFKIPATGVLRNASSSNPPSIGYITQSKIIELQKDTEYSYDSGTWSDTVTTI